MNGSWKPCATHSPMNGELKTVCGSYPIGGNLISTDHLKKGRLSQEGMDFFATSAAGMIASVTTNRDLQNVLAATSLLDGGIKNKSTFYEHAMINNSYLESAYRFTEGKYASQSGINPYHTRQRRYGAEPERVTQYPCQG